MIDEIKQTMGGFKILWSGPEGWGEVTFHIVDGQFEIESECMGEEFVMELLHEAIDKARIVE